MSDLREALEQAVSAPEVEAEPVIVEAATPETSPEQAEPTPDKTEQIESNPTSGEASEKPVEAGLSDQEKETPYSKAPASWKGQAKEVWAALPETARKEVMRRERQINQVLHETAEVRQNYQAVQQVAQQYEGKLKEWGAQPHQVFQEFMEADRNLSSGPMPNRAAYMAKLIKEYAIDLRDLDSALAGTAPAPQFDVQAQVEAIVNQRLAPFQQRMQAEEQAQVQQAAQTIQAMEGNPDYPHFEDVREEMADLIELNFKRGIAISLDEAYNRTVGYKGLAKPQRNAQDTQKALAASVSVGGSPAAVSNAGNPSDLRGTILQALEGGRR
jgi:hypothetical protein